MDIIIIDHHIGTFYTRGAISATSALQNECCSLQLQMKGR